LARKLDNELNNCYWYICIFGSEKTGIWRLSTQTQSIESVVGTFALGCFYFFIYKNLFLGMF